MEWSFAVRSYFHLTGWISDSILTNAEMRKGPTGLCASCSNRKRLGGMATTCATFEHDDVDSSFDLYQAILNYTFSSDLANVEDQLTHLDLLEQKYEVRSQDLIADNVLRGIIMNGAPETLRTHLRGCSAQCGTPRMIRIAVREYVASQRKEVPIPWTATTSTTTLMECDILQRGKTKGKDKNKQQT